MSNNENQKPAVVTTPASTATTTPVAKQDNTTGAACSMSPADKNVEKFNAEIKKTWSKLSDEDLKLQSTQPEQFFAKLQEKQGVNKVDAEKKLAELKTSCGCTAEKAA